MGVRREIAVFELAFFPMSSIPAILLFYLIFAFADTTLQVTSLQAHSVSRTFPGGPAFAAWWRTLHCNNFGVLDGASYGRLTKFLRNLLASVAPKKNKESKRADEIFQSSSRNFAPLVAKARPSVRRKGDRKEIAKLKAKPAALEIHRYPPALQLFLS